MYYIYKLDFFYSNVHFGNKKLNDTKFTIDSKTLFSAIINETALMFGQELIDEIVTNVNDGNLLFSDLFPYNDDDLFLPKPHLTLNNSTKDLTEYKNYKNLKKAQFISLTEYQSLFNDIKNNKPFKKFDITSFGQDVVHTKNNLQNGEPLLYEVASFKFDENNGLYFICYCSDDSLKEKLDEIMDSLGNSGIGGKKSTGYGVFEVSDIYEVTDDMELYTLLNKKTNNKVLLSFCVPSVDEVTSLDLEQSQYQLESKSGFSYSLTGKTRKKQELVGFKSGSVFPQELNGQLIDQKLKDDPHSIYVYAKGIYLNV